jgi:hypothetical protein
MTAFPAAIAGETAALREFAERTALHLQWCIAGFCGKFTSQRAAIVLNESRKKLTGADRDSWNGVDSSTSERGYGSGTEPAVSGRLPVNFAEVRRDSLFSRQLRKQAVAGAGNR